MLLCHGCRVKGLDERSVPADPKAKVYGAALPALTFQVSGLVNGDTQAV